MPLYVIAVGRRMPRWVVDGYQDYARRLPSLWAPRLIEVASARRSKTGNPSLWKQQESQRLLTAIPADSRVIACDEKGESWTTKEVARHLQTWMSAGRNVALVIGGPDGLASECLQRATHQWSLSSLTLPHGLIRVIVAEQIYRAFSLLSHHPYHRAGS